MTRVFEALRREQENKKGTAGRDPLVVETGAPDDVSNAESEIVATELEISSVIGSPAAPRSNEGMVFPSISGGNGDHQVVLTHHSSSMHGVHGVHGVHGAPEQTQAQTAVAAKPETANRATETNRSPQPETARQTAAPREIPVERLNPSRLHPRLILLTEPELPECEQYRTLRTQLFHAAEKRQTQVVVITSAVAGEGKTATALNLALAIAQSKENRVLVLDGDLRRPNIASYLGLRPGAGFGEVLSGDLDALGSIVCLDDPELYLLPVSREVVNPTELLSSERFAETIGELREYFDFILVDSPPVMPFADARLLANHSDAVMLVVRAGMTPYETVEKAVDVLPAGRMLGVVLNGAEHLQETDYYDYYYSYTQRQQRRRTLLGKFSSRIRASWVGRKMKL